MIAIPMKETSTYNVVQAYSSGILAHKGRCVVILSDNVTEFQTKSQMKHAANWVLKGYSLTHFIHKEIQKLRLSIIS